MPCVLKRTDTIPPIVYWECGDDVPFLQASQARVSVSGPNVLVVSSAGSEITAREIVLQNIGTAPIAVRYGLGAASDCSNGEFVLKAGTANNDGTGGSVTINGWLGQMTAACASSSFLSVTTTINQ